MTDRERATRDTLVAELEGRWFGWGLSSLERDHLKEDFNPAFVAWKLEQMTKYSDAFLFAAVLATWAAFALSIAYYAPLAQWASLIQPITFGMAVGFVPYCSMCRTRAVYRALHALSTGEEAST